ncbi:MAG TPA: RNA polymerase sigma factor [Xanthomonadaceae bacterium]|nr:RNA polymerase sigma factor [Xanthomonadaceae bacterium]
MRPPPTDAPDAGRPASAFAQPVGTALLAAAQRGEPAALEQIYRCFERPVYTLALRMCGDRDEAQDILQETMLKVIGGIGGFRGDNGSPFWGWLRQIAVNETLQRLRRRRALEVEAFDALDAIADAAPPPAAAANAARLSRALQTLPTATRSVLWLYHAEGYTHEEIGILMQRSPSFSKSQVARGLRRLRTLLQAEPVARGELADV